MVLVDDVQFDESVITLDAGDGVGAATVMPSANTNVLTSPIAIQETPKRSQACTETLDADLSRLNILAARVRSLPSKN